MGFKLSDLKEEIKKSGSNKGKFLYFREGEKVRVRFLTDLEDGIEILWHDSYKEKINVPCQETFGRECKYCDEEDLRTRKMYIWSVYDYGSKEVKLLMAAVNQCSPVPALVAEYEERGSLLDRDYIIKQIGSGQGKSFSVIGMDKEKFRNTKAKPLSESAILKYVDKAYPDTEADYEGEEEEKPKRNKTKTKGNKKKEEPELDMNEPEEDEEADEEEKDYEEMTAKQLYSLCKDRDIDCKPKKAKEYYIDLLEEADEEDSDDWGEDEEDEEDDW